MKTINREFLKRIGFEENYEPSENSGCERGYTYWTFDVFDPESPDNIIQLISTEVHDEEDEELTEEKLNTTDITVSLFDSMAGKCIYENELTTLIRILKRFDHV